MRLVTERELGVALEQQFGPLEPHIRGLRLLAGGLGSAELERLEADLDVRLTGPFRSALQQYDLGHFSLGPIAFGFERRYEDVLRELNGASAAQWWGDGPRPRSMLMFANSDPFAFLVDTRSAGIWALEHGTQAQQAIEVARGFDLFLRGAGTLLVARVEADDSHAAAKEVARQVHSSPQGERYWKELAGVR